LSENKLVIFISDNGGALYTHATTNAPFQGGTFTLFEGGIRVPYAMRWPGKIPAGARYEAPVSSLDIVSTVATAVGLELPADRPFDGVDLLPFVRGEKAGEPHEALYWRAGTVSAIRRGPLKLLRDRESNTVALFDLLADPSEQSDLSKARPADVVALSAQLDGWSAQCHEPLWPEVMEYRFVDTAGREWWYPL
jgi:arylsulfatase A-like enzyme